MSAVASCFEILYQDKERNGAILDYILNLGQRYYDAFLLMPAIQLIWRVLKIR